MRETNYLHNCQVYSPHGRRVRGPFWHPSEKREVALEHGWLREHDETKETQ